VDLESDSDHLNASPFSSIFSKAERALLVLTFPNISLTLLEVLKTKVAIIGNFREAKIR
jgi:hypothetical protein